MTDDRTDWYDMSVRDFLSRVSDTKPDDPPGAIAAVALALAVSASLLIKCTSAPELKAVLGSAVADSLRLSIQDGHAYNEWKLGDHSSKAIEQFPNEMVVLADRVVEIADSMPPNVMTGLTDIMTAATLAAGSSAAAALVRKGNVGLL